MFPPLASISQGEHTTMSQSLFLAKWLPLCLSAAVVPFDRGIPKWLKLWGRAREAGRDAVSQQPA